MSNKVAVSWETSATKVPARTKRRTRASAPVSYPIFKEAAKFTEDPEWIAMLEKAEIGQFPTGFSYSKETMWYRSKNGGEDVKLISTIDPGQFFKEIRSFMNKHGTVTKMDTSGVTTNEAIIDGNDWINLPARYRQAVIGKFVEEQKRSKELSYQETMQLISIIRTGTLIGAFEKNNFHISNFTIASIDRLFYDEKNKRYFIDPSFVPTMKPSSKSKSSSTKVTKSYNDYWDAFMKFESDQLSGNKKKILEQPSESETEDYSGSL